MKDKIEPQTTPIQTTTDIITDVTNVETLDTVEHVESIEEATEIVEQVQQANTAVVLQTKDVATYNLDVRNFEELTLGAQLAIFKEMSTDPQTGITNPAMGLLKFQRAKELGIPWANAVSHMHIIKNKVGIDINICQAILTRPRSGITWSYVEEYEPLYDYIDINGNQYAGDNLPPNAEICETLSEKLANGKFAVVIMPTLTPNPLNPKAPMISYRPTNYRTIIEFKRKKKDIDDTWITQTEKGVFSWKDAVQAGLAQPDSNWTKRPKFMIYKSAFWDGAKKIANDLLNGAYDTDDLLAIKD